MREPSTSLHSRVIAGGMGIVFMTFGGGFIAAVNGSDAPAAFRVVGSVAGAFFMLVGGGLLLRSILRKGIAPGPEGIGSRTQRDEAMRALASAPNDKSSPSPGRLACRNCAAPLRDDVEISPSGDVKCPFCRSWFNVRA